MALLRDEKIQPFVNSVVGGLLSIDARAFFDQPNPEQFLGIPTLIVNNHPS